MLFVQLHKKWGWWKSSPRKSILQPEIFIWFVLQEEGKGQEGAGKLLLKSFVKPLLLISVVKGNSSLHFASLKCKCYCKMRCVVFSVSLFGCGNGSTLSGNWQGVGGWGVTSSLVYLSRNQVEILVPETSYNPLLLKPVFMLMKGNRAGVFVTGVFEAGCGQTECIPPAGLASAPREAFSLHLASGYGSS